jgi:hypothetical protein
MGAVKELELTKQDLDLERDMNFYDDNMWKDNNIIHWWHEHKTINRTKFINDIEKCRSLTQEELNIERDRNFYEENIEKYFKEDLFHNIW